ncbi:MAG: ATP-dependent helicase HrpB [Candidatus Devosia phytovorans]|uniref:ATP-dependent helicase HrpB n=1 Tax=Candidatus Devosia phytovorans TaxID=3121372 RepID=A0AAJ5VZ45_9HYPH|nr:ATP-dependent helicase HrpB [Devosia sp.]WEK06691.1 MAG: ATP-dependent helicase HrpB [Devosia sp.]
MLSSLPPLPIDDALPQLRAALEAGPYAVLVAPPGAGKTTRVPLALLDAPWRGDRRIIVLEPRRLAARAAAGQMARLLGENVGDTVGYRVRMDSKISSRTRVEIVTEGVFTRMLLDDPELTGIAAVLFDEFHERSLDGDLGLALALDAAALRPDLRVLVMSATIDGARVARLLQDAPVVESLGRAFPVETIHREPDALQRLEDQVTSAVLSALREHDGSALVFLPGQGEITRVAERLASRVATNVDIAPLYGQLTPAEQDRAIHPAEPGRRKVVLATSIAETSLTIDGVRIVIDSGFRRIPVYEPNTGLTTLATARVSRAGADQRRGRAGRTSPGIAIRLWNEGQTAALEQFDTPEILAADLSGFALDLANWGVTDPAALALLDPPPAPAWNEAITLLKSLDALDDHGRITTAGKALARLPLHPRLAHMVVAADGDPDTAAELAVLVTERGLGGDAVDLAHRLDRFRTDRSRRADDARALARRWSKLAGGQSTRSRPACWHLAHAFPDRIAQAAGARGKFRLANGRQASLDEAEPLASAQYLVVTDMTGAAASSRIRSAVAIDRTTIEDLYDHQTTETETLSFDAQSGSVRARKTRTLDALRLSDEPVPITDLVTAADLLAEAAARNINALPWTRDQKALRARSTYLHQTLGTDWPDLSDDALAVNAKALLSPYILGETKLSAITAAHLGNALDAVLPWSQRKEIDRLLPSHFTAPSGSYLPIDYAAENGPALEIRVQELFGLDRHPAIAGGKVPLLLILLSPAHRPIQTTRDLPGFWRGSWKDVAKDLKGRYPRHFWPDDPITAAATARAKPRGT